MKSANVGLGLGLIVLTLGLVPQSVRGAGAPAASPEKKATPTKAEAPKSVNHFGIKPEWVTSPAMLTALRRLNEAGVIEGRRGSLTFFRWTNAEPPKLAHLGLWGAKVDNQLLIQTAAVPDLEYVGLYETSVDDAGVAALAKLPKLRRLAIAPIARYEKQGFGPTQWSYPFMKPVADRPRITSKGLQAFAGLPTIEDLDLLDAQLVSSDLALLSGWPKLSALSLPNRIDTECVQHLQTCRRLNSLTLGYRDVTAAELECLAAWKSLRRLTVIHAKLSDEALGALSKLETLEELHLEDCNLTDDRLRYLQPSAKLVELSLKRNEIDGPGLAHLQKLRLRTLGLEFNNIHDATLSHLPQLETLENLWLAYCRGITDSGIHSGTLQKMTHLKRLNLRGLKELTDESLDDLEKFTHLEHVGLRETKVSWDGVARLKKTLPKLDVFK